MLDSRKIPFRCQKAPRIFIEEVSDNQVTSSKMPNSNA